MLMLDRDDLVTLIADVLAELNVGPGLNLIEIEIGETGGRTNQ